MRTNLLPPQNTAFCTPVPGTDLYILADFSRYNVELIPLDAEGDYAGPTVRVDLPDARDWGMTEGYARSLASGADSALGSMGHLSPSTGFKQHPDGHRALAFAATLGADLLDALREGAEEERRAARAEARAKERAWKEAEETEAAVDRDVEARLRGFYFREDVRLSSPRFGTDTPEDFVKVSGMLMSAEGGYVVLQRQNGEEERVPTRKILAVEAKDRGRYAPAFSRADLRAPEAAR